MVNKLDTRERAQIIRALVEGNSIRSTVRMTGFAKNTITKLLVELGIACADYQDTALRNLPATRIECDEIWSFVGMKAKSVPEERRGEPGIGDVWTWTALDPDSKVMCSCLIGDKGPASANGFIADLAGRLANRVQITTDGNSAYLQAIERAFGRDVDYAMLVKEYGHDPSEERRFSPPVVLQRTGPRHRGQSRPRQDQHQLRRAVESHHANGDAPHDPPDQRLLKEG